jgi:hypothetical protein
LSEGKSLSSGVFLKGEWYLQLVDLALKSVLPITFIKPYNNFQNQSVFQSSKQRGLCTSPQDLGHQHDTDAHAITI